VGVVLIIIIFRDSYPRLSRFESIGNEEQTFFESNASKCLAICKMASLRSAKISTERKRPSDKNHYEGI
jgi:hypothetical protein